MNRAKTQIINCTNKTGYVEEDFVCLWEAYGRVLNIKLHSYHQVTKHIYIYICVCVCVCACVRACVCIHPDWFPFLSTCNCLRSRLDTFISRATHLLDTYCSRQVCNGTRQYAFPQFLSQKDTNLNGIPEPAIPWIGTTNPVSNRILCQSMRSRTLFLRKIALVLPYSHKLSGQYKSCMPSVGVIANEIRRVTKNGVSVATLCSLHQVCVSAH
jgi:hypothetical protein